MPERVVLASSVRDALSARARDGAPEEVCGVLIGTDEGQSRVARDAERPSDRANGPKAREETKRSDDVLVGDADAPPFRVREARPVENVADDPRTRYELDPAATLAAIDAAEAAGADVVGFYHSHPRGPAEPSATDEAEAAWPGYVYCIVVPDDEAGTDAPDGGATIRAWRWTGEAFTPLAVDAA